jgi:hypothetical protein
MAIKCPETEVTLSNGFGLFIIGIYSNSKTGLYLLFEKIDLTG